MEHYALKIANTLIGFSQSESHFISRLALMKMSYICHGYILALLDKNTDNTDHEFVQAWKYGPVFPSIYYAFNINGKDTITKKSSIVYFDDNGNQNIITPEFD